MVKKKKKDKNIKKPLTARDFWKTMLVAGITSPVWVPFLPIFVVIVVLLVVLVLLPIVLPIAFLVSGPSDIYETDPTKYERPTNAAVAAFFPENLDEYTVNRYAYTYHVDWDVGEETFLDLTVTQEQFDELIESARKVGYIEREAYYAEGYYEIIYNDYYEREYEPLEEGEVPAVYEADIIKLVYNPETLNVVCERLYVQGPWVYGVEEICYFNRFNLDEKEYVKHLPTVYETTDVAKYDDRYWHFPEDISAYTVESYFYRRTVKYNTDYEIMLELTVSEEQLAALLEEANIKKHATRETYYAEGYYEIVYSDEYRISKDTISGIGKVGDADITKIVYNPETCHVLYVAVVASKVTDVKDVAYFNYFGIDEREYVEHLPQED